MDTATDRPAEHVKDFIAYEYKAVTTDRDQASLYADCLPQFGWTLEDNSFSNRLNSVSLTFKRNRQLKNKLELNKLQRRFEESVSTVAHLERSKTTRASIVAYTVGLLATAFMAGATFSFIGGNLIACIILAIPGFIGWGVSYVFYRNLTQKYSARIIPEIDRELDALYATCERAHALSIA